MKRSDGDGTVSGLDEGQIDPEDLARLQAAFVCHSVDPAGKVPPGWAVPELDSGRIHSAGLDIGKPRALTGAEIEGRKKCRAVMDIVRKYGPAGSEPILMALAAQIGIRQTRNFRCALEHHCAFADLDLLQRSAAALYPQHIANFQAFSIGPGPAREKRLFRVMKPHDRNAITVDDLR